VPRPPSPGEAAPGIRYAGIGDEAGRTLEQQIAAVTGLGWRTIELRTIGGVCLADLPDAEFERCAEALERAGLATACVDSRIADWSRPIGLGLDRDLADLDRLGPRCAALGTRWVRVMSYPNDGLDDAGWEAEVVRRMRILAARAAGYGLVLLHENCAGWAGRSAERALRLLDRVGSPSLRLLFDIGNGAAYGYDAHAMLVRLLDACPEAVAHVHVKDAVGSGEQTAYVLPGTGESRVADCLRLLAGHGFTGTWSIEPHLALRPHESRTALGADGPRLFAEYGRHLERLVAAEVFGTAR
jgi:sugar phosphate isomerase/epimerase